MVKGKDKDGEIEREFWKDKMMKREEVVKALRQIKCSKADGVDGLISKDF